MTPKDFFAKANRLGKWRKLADGRVRRECLGHGTECPITAVANHSSLNRMCMNSFYSTAGKFIGLNPKQTEAIARAADGVQNRYTARVNALLPKARKK